MASTSRALCLLMFTLAVCQVATARRLAADPTPRERVQQAFKEITDLSDKLRVATQNINVFNAGQQGFVIVQGFTGIVTEIAEYTARIPDPTSNAAPFGDDDAKLVVESLTTFVKVHQALLNVVIGKHGLLTLFPFFEPIRVSLVSLEEVVDNFAFKLIGMIPTQKSNAIDQFSSLSTTVKQAIDTYSQPILNTGVVTGGPSLQEAIVQSFKEITTMSDNLRIDTQKITLINAPLQGYTIAQGFTSIIARVGQASSQLSTLDEKMTLGDDDAKAVVAALTTFVQVHQALLNVVINKHGIFTLIPFFEPIRQALVSLEATIDTFAFYLIAVIPSQKSAADAQVGSLAVTVQLAINTYEQPLLSAFR